jgi:hypothetical protein
VLLPHHLPVNAITGMGIAWPHDGRCGKGQHLNIQRGDFFMRRVTTICAAVTIAATTLISGAAFAKYMRAPANGYYVIRWHNTGVCTIWNTDLQEKPWHFFSDYEVVSKPVPTFTEAAGIQENMRLSHHCTL